MHGSPRPSPGSNNPPCTGDYAKFKEYTHIADNEHPPVFLRDMLDFRRNPIDIERVEPEEAIMRRFVSGLYRTARSVARHTRRSP